MKFNIKRQARNTTLIAIAVLFAALLHALVLGAEDLCNNDNQGRGRKLKGIIC
jgi:hypothetical protein